jgi:dCTP diphosphatase
MSDVLLYLIDLANKCHVDLPTAVLDKMAHNERKYPEDKSYGRANKYND